MSRTRLVCGRALAAASAVLVAAVGAGCTTDDDPTVVAAPAEAIVAEEPVTARTVETPTDGALRTRVAAIDAPADGPGRVLLFGDSVAVLVADELAGELPATELVVDAVDCRRLDRGFRGPCGGVPDGATVSSGLEGLVRAVDEVEGPLDAAVIVIANNAALAADDLDDAMGALTSVGRVWWVTTDVDGRGWRDPNNALLRDLAQREPRAGVIDWFEASQGRSWRVDHVHPDELGQVALAELVADHLRCDCVP